MIKHVFKFLLPEEVYASTDFRIKKQLPFLALTSAILLPAFTLLIFVSLLSSKGIIGLFQLIVAVLIILIIDSLLSLRKGKYKRASWIMSMTLLASSIATLYTMNYTGTFFEPYRPFGFSAVMAACTMLVSLDRKQVRVFGIVWVTGWVLSFFTIFKDLLDANLTQTIAILLIGGLGIFLESTVLDQVRKLSNDLLDTALDQSQKATEAFNQISELVSEATAGMEIGEQIQRAAGSLLESVDSVTTIQNYLSSGSENLIKESDNFSNTSATVTQSIDSMKKNLDEQSSAITQTSAAITQISTNLQNISEIATKRRMALSEITQGTVAQRELIQKLLTSVHLVQESSEGIMMFVHTVQDIASRTGLLSMNASIEAARAGTAGKGFSIIAQEIRALSEETEKNADTIKHLIDNNDLTVENTAQMTNDFATYIEKNSTEMSDLLGSIDEILRGITEMDVGTREVMHAVQEIVSAGSESSDLVHTVVQNVSIQREGFDTIAQFARELHDRIVNLQRAVKDIRGVSKEIAEAGANNTLQVKKIQEHLQV